MPLDHHGREIADLLPKCVERNIKTLGFYLDSRFITTKQLQKVSRDDNLILNKDSTDQDN